MTSIYRRDSSPPKADLGRPGQTDLERREQEAAGGGQSEEAGRRKAQPSNTVLPMTRRWMNSIPAEYRPQTLPIRFGRIANLIAASWDNPKECTAYISSLLHDGRGGRKGFPPEVVQDLRDLRVYYATLHPLVVWEQDPEPPKR